MLTRDFLEEGGHYLRKYSRELSTLSWADHPEMVELVFKVIIIGDATVGKTSFVQRYIQDTFRSDYRGTVGVDFALKILRWSEEEDIKLQLWDIAGQERFTWMTRVYYKDAHGAIIMFDLSNKASFINSAKWKKEVDSKCLSSGGYPIPCILLANKCDITHRKVKQLEIEQFCQNQGFIGWTETSAKEGLMINDSMRFLIEMMKKQSEDSKNALKTEDIIKLEAVNSSKKSCKCKTS